MSMAVFKGTASSWAWSHIWLVVRVVGVNPSLVLCQCLSSHCKWYSSNCSLWKALAVCIPNNVGIGEGKAILTPVPFFRLGKFEARLRWRIK